MKKKIAILGAGGHGRVIADLAEDCGYSEIIFCDDKWPDLSLNLVWPIVTADLAAVPVDFDIIPAIGDCSKRLSLLRTLRELNRNIPTLVHARAFVSRHAKLGQGTVVLPQASVNVGAVIGGCCIVNTSASVDHDCVLQDGVHISPGAHLAGGVHVGEGSWIGIGASVKEGIQIGRNVIVGAGATVIRDVADGARMLGVPAKDTH